MADSGTVTSPAGVTVRFNRAPSSVATFATLIAGLTSPDSEFYAPISVAGLLERDRPPFNPVAFHVHFDPGGESHRECIRLGPVSHGSVAHTTAWFHIAALATAAAGSGAATASGHTCLRLGMLVSQFYGIDRRIGLDGCPWRIVGVVLISLSFTFEGVLAIIAGPTALLVRYVSPFDKNLVVRCRVVGFPRWPCGDTR